MISEQIPTEIPKNRHFWRHLHFWLKIVIFCPNLSKKPLSGWNLFWLEEEEDRYILQKLRKPPQKIKDFGYFLRSPPQKFYHHEGINYRHLGNISPHLETLVFILILLFDYWSPLILMWCLATLMDWNANRKEMNRIKRNELFNNVE